MRKIVLVAVGAVFSVLAGEQSFASQSRTITFEDVREEGGFNSKSLINVMELTPSGRNLNEEEIEGLITSKTLTNLRTLDLRNQPLVNDDFITRFVNNSTFSRILTLKLSGTNITNESIAKIVNSTNLGSIRDLPQVSGKYNVPSSVIRVYTKDTGVTDTTQKTTFDFHIEYKPPNPTSYPWEPVDHGVKIVEIEAW